jgi:polyisoprenoid-binding protein YceI
MDSKASSIKFRVIGGSAPLSGEFKNFKADITLDPATGAGQVSVEIPVADITTGVKDQDSKAVGKDWFDTKSFPKATYVTHSIEHRGENQYVAHGNLTIRGVSFPQDLPFTLDISKTKPAVAEMKAKVTLNRLDFGVGQGEWKSTGTVGNPVEVSIYVKAQAQ